MTTVALTAVEQRSWTAKPADASRHIKYRMVVWTMDLLGKSIMGPYVCLNSEQRKLYDPVNREAIIASPDSIPFTQSSVMDNALEVHSRNGKRKMVEKDLAKIDDA